MRPLAFAALVAVAALVGACTAIDDFTKFTFVDGGGHADMTGALPGFGDPCTGSCAAGPVLSRPLSCFTQFGGKPVPGGICTRTCTPSAGAVACSDYPDAVCVTIENTDVCMPRCDLGLGRGCRTNFSCCANGNMVQMGACAPTMLSLCH